MSKAHAKQITDQAAQNATQEASGAGADRGAATVVSAAPAPAPAQDEHHGHGGLYTRVNGSRVPVDRTQQFSTNQKEAQQ